MFIRRTQTRNRSSGEPYVTHRLVHSVRVGSSVKQSTLLNLGSHFDLPQDQWAALAARIDGLVRGQGSLVESTLSDAGQALAQRYAAQLIALQPSAPSITPAQAARAASSAGDADRFQEVDLDTLEMVRARSVGVEHAALSAMRQCALEDKLAELGMNRPQIAAAVGNIIGRMACPGSELATHTWLQQRSALGELMDFDFEAMDLNRLYRASDALYKHREALQDHLFDQAKSIFGFGETVTLYDLTNTYFEGVGAGVAKAKRGHSKESRSDCPLVTLAMVLDGSGFPRRSRVFAGNASEPATLAQMLTGLRAPPGATVVMDAGIATEVNLTWLREQGYHYVVVSRLRGREFDPAQASEVQSAGGVQIKIHRKLDAQGHALLYCHSPAREQKDRAIDDTKAAGFEAVLVKLQEGLSKPRGTNDAAKIMERLGRARQRYARAAQHYEVDVAKDDTGLLVQAITWTKKIKPASAAMHPGVYCLRTTLVELDNATLWRTYTMLTNLESVFRSLKTDLGLRPVFHQVERRVEGHLFISVLAYHFVHMLRLRLKGQGIDDSWETLRQAMSTQQRVTATMQRRDGRAIHVRKATRADAHHHKINTILGLSPNPGGTHRVIV
jgi:transposase